jgi:hypothetical protein
MLSELKEQSRVVNWCRERGIRVSATAQSTFTDSWKAINRNITSGVVKGVPDLIIVIPKEFRKNGENKTVFIEMKKENGGTVSKEQREWIKDLDDSTGVSASICYGHEEAIIFLSNFLEKIPPIDNTFIDNLLKNAN